MSLFFFLKITKKILINILFLIVTLKKNNSK